MNHVAAIDLGASSGRVMLYDGDRLREAYRFPSRTVKLETGLHWDFPYLLREVRTGIREAAGLAARLGDELVSVGIDAWGVDFGLVDEAGQLIEWPMHYRNSAMSGLSALLDHELAGHLYERTGIPPLDINTLTQLTVLQRDRPEVLERARHLLPIADLLVFFLTDPPVVGAELSAASTTQLLHPDGQDWHRELLRELSPPDLERLMPPLRRAGTFAGRLDPAQGLPPLPVITVAEHDTASAIYTTQLHPGEGGLFLSCGTWGLLGTVLEQPLMTDAAFSNERDGHGHVAYLRNIPGMWLLQETRRQLAREGHTYTYAEMEQLAREAGPFGATVDINHPDFSKPGDIPAVLRQHLEKQRRQQPWLDKAVLRCVYESLATAFADAAQQIATLTGQPARTLHLMGGGGRDSLLRELLEQAIPGLRIVPGATEASALGNALMQVHACEELSLWR